MPGRTPSTALALLFRPTCAARRSWPRSTPPWCCRTGSRPRTSTSRVRRPGRGVALDRAKRAAVWDVIAAYRAAGRAYGRVDFDEVAALASSTPRPTGRGRRAACSTTSSSTRGRTSRPTGGSCCALPLPKGRTTSSSPRTRTSAIYGQRITLSTYGIRVVGRSRRLRLNYRTTAQVLRWAMSVLDGGDYTDVEGEAEDHTGYRSARSGPEVAVLPAASSGDELDVAASTITSWLADDIAPETRGRIGARPLPAGACGQRTRRAWCAGPERLAPRPCAPGQPVVMTMHRSKGTEFGRVVLFGLREGAIPAVAKDQEYDESARTDAELRERSLALRRRHACPGCPGHHVHRGSQSSRPAGLKSRELTSRTSKSAR